MTGSAVQFCNNQGGSRGTIRVVLVWAVTVSAVIAVLLMVTVSSRRPVSNAGTDPDICIDCGKCAIVCPHNAMGMKVFSPDGLDGAPDTFVSKPFGAQELATPHLK